MSSEKEWFTIESQLADHMKGKTELILYCDCYEPLHQVIFRYEPKYDDNEAKIHWPSILRITHLFTWNSIKARIKKAFILLLHGRVMEEGDVTIEGDGWMDEMRKFISECEKVK